MSHPTWKLSFCVWEYRGPTCCYRGPPVDLGPVDRCGKTFEECKARGNEKHFGGMLYEPERAFR